MNLPFVIPGHYVSVETIDSEDKKIIRVLCEGQKKDHFKVLNEKREFSESEILSGYEYMSTNDSEFKPLISLGNIPEDSEIEENNQQEDVSIYQIEMSKQPKVYKSKPALAEYIPDEIERTYVQPIQIPQKTEEEISVDSLLQKIKNEKQEIISIPINFNFKYDIEKLKDLIKIMDIDKSTTKLIINKLIDDSLKENVIPALESTINNLINNNITIEKENNIIQNKVIVDNTKNEDITKIDKNNLYGENSLTKKYNISISNII